MERDKLMESKDEESAIPKTVEDEVKKVVLDWHTASASYYDSQDPEQTRSDCDGVGAFGNLIKSGSVALGSTFTETFRKNGMEVFIQIKGFNIVTPYGKGIFRVDDAMADRFNRKNHFYIDFFHEDLTLKRKLQGRFKVLFKIVKIKAAS